MHLYVLPVDLEQLAASYQNIETQCLLTASLLQSL